MNNWTTIYEKTSPKILAVCRRYVKDEQLSEDILQETFITAIEKANDQFKGGNIEVWIRRIAINKCLEYFRKNKQHFVDVEDSHLKSESEDEILPKSNKSRIIAANFNNKELLQIIDDLPIHHKTVFNMYVIDNVSHKEISQLLNISLGTSKSHLSRARKKIKEKLLTMVDYKEEKKRKLRGVFYILPLTFFVDNVFSQQLSNHEINPSTETPSFIKNAKELSFNKALISYALKLKIGIALIVVTAITSFFVINSKKEKTIEIEEANVVFLESPIVLDSKANSTVESKLDEQKTVVEIDKKPTKQAKVKPLIDKTVIIKDTVYRYKR